MQSIITFLCILDRLSLALGMLWAPSRLSRHPLALEQTTIIRSTAFADTIHLLSLALGVRAPAPSSFKPGANRPPLVLNSPAFALHNFSYAIVMHKVSPLPPPERAAFNPYLRGSCFACLADSLLDNNPSPMLARYNIKLDAHQRDIATYIATIPELVVTPPEDGNRRAEPGQRGGGPLWIVRGLLAPPRVSPIGKHARDKLRLERAKRALRQKIEKAASMKAGGES